MVKRSGGRYDGNRGGSLLQGRQDGSTAMSHQDLLDLLRSRPFVPFRMYATDGRTYDVRHPDQALVLRTRVVLPVPTASDLPERSEQLALVHIIRAEELSAEPASGVGSA